MTTTPLPAPYPPDPGFIGKARDGQPLTLRPMTPEAATTLGHGLAAIDPWARVAREGDGMVAFFARIEEAGPRYRILAGDDLAGALVVRNPWLHGPYLNLIGLLPPFHGQGIGGGVLDWFEAEARRAANRNVWLCVSSYNHAARRLYERQGYRAAAELADLTRDGFDELLMRKRLA